MKVICPNCGVEQEISGTSQLEAAAGEGLAAPAVCAKCGGILPSFTAASAAAADAAPTAAETPSAIVPDSAELDSMRSELEAEVGSLFDAEPSREIKTGGYRLGERRRNPRFTEPQTPAYEVVEISDHDHKRAPASESAAAVDEPAAPAEASAVAAAPPAATTTAAAKPQEVVWQPAASSLSDLIQEQFSTSRRRAPEEPADELVKPPEIKHRPAPPPEPARRPPPAFDGDVPEPPVAAPSATVDVPAVSIPAPAQRSDSMIAVGTPPVVVNARPNTLLVALALLGIVSMLCMIAVLVVVLLRSPQLLGSGGTAVAPPLPAAPDAAPAAIAAAVDASPVALLTTAPDAAPAAVADAAPAVALADPTPPPDTVDTPPPLKPRPDDPGYKPPKETSRHPVKTTAEEQEEEEEEEEEEVKKPDLPPGTRPPGCDPVLYPDVADCPKAGPPGKEQILAVVRKNLRDIDICAKRQHQLEPELATGVVEMRFYINSTGETSRVEVLTEQYRKAPVGLCIKAAIERWNFGEYDGPRIGPIKFPFKLKVE
ncbi:MAG: AgmX/PglI C-terminal domain-containing protein [Deltaproteobacteria bacterium]|nr:AgmX/PglI C-terminal domain-containing protein [Deltaproteobacteria bacterium]